MTRLMERACELPCVSPQVVGQPHQHMYLVGDRFGRRDAWGPVQVIVLARSVGLYGRLPVCMVHMHSQ